jgi:hypothetical protein
MWWASPIDDPISSADRRPCVIGPVKLELDPAVFPTGMSLRLELLVERRRGPEAGQPVFRIPVRQGAADLR